MAVSVGISEVTEIVVFGTRQIRQRGPEYHLQRLAYRAISTSAELLVLCLDRLASCRSYVKWTKPKFHESSLLVANVTRMLLACYGRIGHVGRATRTLYEETVAVELRLHGCGCC